MGQKLILSLALFLASIMSVNAQVIIGNNEDPQEFSVLELAAEQRGLRLPQITSIQRETMTSTAEFQAAKGNEALGLVIFNTTTGCMEFWNGTTWVSLCDILIN